VTTFAKSNFYNHANLILKASLSRSFFTHIKQQSLKSLQTVYPQDTESNSRSSQKVFKMKNDTCMSWNISVKAPAF